MTTSVKELMGPLQNLKKIKKNKKKMYFYQIILKFWKPTEKLFYFVDNIVHESYRCIFATLSFSFETNVSVLGVWSCFVDSVLRER